MNGNNISAGSRLSVREFAARVRSVLGLRNTLLVVGFLAANSHVEVLNSLVDEWWAKLAILAALDLAVVAVAVRTVARVGRPDSLEELHPDQMGVRGDHQIRRRRAAVIVLGLDSDDPDGSLSRLLRDADDLEYLALLGTPETRELNMTARVRKLLAAHGRSLSEGNIRVWESNQSLSVGDYAESTAEALGWLLRRGLHPSEIVADVTAGRRMASFGVIQAADAAGVETQYLACRWDHLTHQPVLGERSFRIVSSYHSPDDPTTGS